MCILLQLGFLKVHLLFHVRCLFMYCFVHQIAFFLLHAFHFFAGDNNHGIFLLIRRLSQRHRKEGGVLLPVRTCHRAAYVALVTVPVVVITRVVIPICSVRARGGVVATATVVVAVIVVVSTTIFVPIIVTVAAAVSTHVRM
jgi:hypothetical protein